MTKEARRIVARWAKCEFYVYIRPMTSKYIDRKAKPRIYWTVTVEYRTMPPGHWRGEGYSLSDVILELDETVPKGRRGPSTLEKQPGLGAPAQMQRRAIKAAGKNRKKKS